MKLLFTIWIFVSLLALNPKILADDKSRLVAADNLVSIIHSEESYVSGINQTIAQVLRKHPKLEDSKDAISAAATAYVQKYMPWETMKHEFAKIYAGIFTEEELKALAVFYATPLGQKTITSTPAISTQTHALADKKLQEHEKELLQMLMDALKDPS